MIRILSQHQDAGKHVSGYSLFYFKKQVIPYVISLKDFVMSLKYVTPILNSIHYYNIYCMMIAMSLDLSFLILYLFSW